jgi:hypothetical protein
VREERGPASPAPVDPCFTSARPEFPSRAANPQDSTLTHHRPLAVHTSTPPQQRARKDQGTKARILSPCLAECDLRIPPGGGGLPYRVCCVLRTSSPWVGNVSFSFAIAVPGVFMGGPCYRGRPPLFASRPSSLPFCWGWFVMSMPCCVVNAGRCIVAR